VNRTTGAAVFGKGLKRKAKNLLESVEMRRNFVVGISVLTEQTETVHEYLLKLGNILNSFLT